MVFLITEEPSTAVDLQVEAGGVAADNTKMFVLPKLFYVSAYFFEYARKKINNIIIITRSEKNERKEHKGKGVRRTSKPANLLLHSRVFP